MNAEQLLDAVGEVRDDFLAEADAAPVKRRNTWLRWGAMAACVCLIAVAAFAAPKLLTPPVADVPVQAGLAPEQMQGGGYAPEAPERGGASVNTGMLPASASDIALSAQEKDGKPYPDSGNTPSAVPDAPGPTATPRVEPDVPEISPTHPATGNLPDQPVNGPMLREGDEVPDYTPMISGYGTALLTDKSVAAGGVLFSQQLTEALAAYGDSATYRVMAELFRDGVEISGGSAEAKAEMERLAAEGYTVAFETYFDGYAEHYYFTLHATAAQLESFSAGSECGWFLMLYNEYFGIPGAYQEMTGFNSPCGLPLYVDEADEP